jgi:hypothetical protein
MSDAKLRQVLNIITGRAAGAISAAVVAALLSACGAGEPDGPVGAAAQAAAASSAPTADIALSEASAEVTLTGDSAWSLSKTGSLSGGTVSWNIAATETATVSGQLVIQGHMTVTNSGNGPATIGNILVNLQTRQGNTWVTRSTNIADATNGNDAVTAHIHKAASSEGRDAFAENAASGDLNFMDATNNTLFSLVPQVLIAPGETRALLFQASFDNTVLNLAAGTSIRSEVIVSFGNATKSGNSTPNVDINGNGVIDSDEAHVRSVPARLSVVVPAQTAGNGSVTLSDTLDDIVATGTVSFGNVVINLGATSGTVTATVSGGATGGTITNCAHLTGASSTTNSGGFIFPVINGVDLEACSTITVPGATTPPCTPGTVGCGWKAGDMLTFSQSDWGDSSTIAGNLLTNNFPNLYGSSLVVGGLATMTFTSASAVFDYLAAAGIPAPLTTSLLNPRTSSSGQLGGEVLALRLNVDFSSAGLTASNLGALTICDFTAVPQLNGQTVAQFLATANLVLGGGSAALSPSVAAAVARLINIAFLDGNPSTFAEANLRVGGCD